MFDRHASKVNVHDNENRVKVVVFGSYHSGKTSFIKCIDPKTRLTDVKNHDGTTTVAFDLGIKEYEGYKIYIFGTPGQERFDVAREVVSIGLHAAFIVVDSTRGMTGLEKQLFKELKEHNIPCIILANKKDLPGASIDRVRAEAGGYDRVLSISAATGEGVDEAMDAVVDIIKAL